MEEEEGGPRGSAVRAGRAVSGGFSNPVISRSAASGTGDQAAAGAVAVPRAAAEGGQAVAQWSPGCAIDWEARSAPPASP